VLIQGVQWWEATTEVLRCIAHPNDEEVVAKAAAAAVKWGACSAVTRQVAVRQGVEMRCTLTTGRMYVTAVGAKGTTHVDCTTTKRWCFLKEQFDEDEEGAQSPNKPTPSSWHPNPSTANAYER
jgi:hypothetical protein